jgi:hypothetical protein
MLTLWGSRTILCPPDLLKEVGGRLARARVATVGTFGNTATEGEGGAGRDSMWWTLVKDFLGG